jgi:hypothetical protein
VVSFTTGGVSSSAQFHRQVISYAAVLLFMLIINNNSVP